MQKVRSRLAAPTVRRRTVSGSFHPPFGVLFTFPSRYSFTIGHQVVLSLGRWSSQLPTGLLVPHGTQVPRHGGRSVSRTGVSPSLPHLPRCFRYLTTCSLRAIPAGMTAWSYNPFPATPAGLHYGRFGLVPVRSPLLGESRLISFPPGTEMVQFPGFALWRPGIPQVRFPDSEIPVSTLACQLDGAYRRLLRPSSPPDAKASTVRPSSLDPILDPTRHTKQVSPPGAHAPATTSMRM